MTNTVRRFSLTDEYVDISNGEDSLILQMVDNDIFVISANSEPASNADNYVTLVRGYPRLYNLKVEEDNRIWARAADPEAPEGTNILVITGEISSGLDLDNAVRAANESAYSAGEYLFESQEQYKTFRRAFLDPKTSDPIVDDYGDPLIEGALYFNTATKQLKVYSGAEWQDTALNDNLRQFGNLTVNNAFVPYMTGSGWSSFRSTNFGRNLANSANAAAARSLLELGTAATADIGVLVGIANLASDAANTALSAANLAQQWASRDEDLEVAGGEYSAKHYAIKSSAHAANAASFASSAQNSASLAFGYLSALSSGEPFESPVFASRVAAENVAIDELATYVYVLGRYSPNDGGKSLWQRVESEPAHAAKFQSLDGAWWELSEPVVDLMMIDGDNTGLSDTSSQIQDFIDYLLISGKPGRIGPGTYRLDYGIEMKSGVTIHADPHAVFDCGNWAEANDVPVVQFSGSLGTEFAIGSHLSRGAKALTTAINHSFSAGDVIWIRGQRNAMHADAGEWRLGANGICHFAEFQIVTEVTSVTGVNLISGIIFPNYRADKTAETDTNARNSTTVQKVNPVRGAVWIGGSFVNQVNEVTFQLENTYQCVVSNVVIDKDTNSGSGIVIKRSFMTNAVNCRVISTNASSNATAKRHFMLVGGQGCGFYQCSSTYGTQGYVFTTTDDSGPGLHNSVETSEALFAQHHAVFDTGGTFTTIINDNLFINNVTNGIDVAGRNAHITSNIIKSANDTTSDPNGSGVELSDGWAREAIVAENDIEGFIRGVLVVDGTNANSYFTTHSSSIRDNYIRHCKYGIVVDRHSGNYSNALSNMVIEGNRLREIHITAIDVGKYMAGTSIRNNTITGPLSTYGIYVRGDSTYVDISGNKIYNIGNTATGVMLGAVANTTAFPVWKLTCSVYDNRVIGSANNTLVLGGTGESSELVKPLDINEGVRSNVLTIGGRSNEPQTLANTNMLYVDPDGFLSFKRDDGEVMIVGEGGGDEGDVEANPNTLAMRGATGALKVGNPVDGDHAVNLQTLSSTISGFRSLPAGGSAGQFARQNANGSMSWVNITANDVYLEQNTVLGRRGTGLGQSTHVAIAINNTANTLVLRDSSGRAQFAEPSGENDAVTKSYVDARTVNPSIYSSAFVVGRANSSGNVAAINAVSTAVANTIVIRDSFGRARFADPSNSADAATKNYVDARTIDPSGVSSAFVVGRRTTSGNLTSIGITDAPTANTIAIRNSSGRLDVATPSTGNNAANKSYVDTAVSNAISGLGPLATANTVNASLIVGSNGAHILGKSSGNTYGNLSPSTVKTMLAIAPGDVVGSDGAHIMGKSSGNTYTELSASTVKSMLSITASDVSGLGTIVGRNLTISEDDPTGGSDGDIWFKV